MDFFHMNVITELDVSNNQIEMIPNGAVDSLIQLEILLNYNNKITYHTTYVDPIKTFLRATQPN